MKIDILYRLSLFIWSVEEAEVAAQDRTIWKLFSNQAASADNALCFLLIAIRPIKRKKSVRLAITYPNFVEKKII